MDSICKSFENDYGVPHKRSTPFSLKRGGSLDKRSNPADKRSNRVDKRSNPADKRSNPVDKR
jgi:hypothetical protein